MPILYEGRTTKGAVAGASNLDELFEDMFAEHTAEERELLKKQVRHQRAMCSRRRS